MSGRGGSRGRGRHRDLPKPKSSSCNGISPRRLLLLLAMGLLSAAYSVSLHRKLMDDGGLQLGTSVDEGLDGLRRMEEAPRSIMKVGAPNNATNHNPAIEEERKQKVETVLIIAAVPYDAEHAMALWSQLECVTEGVDRVLLSAPDTSWSREIMSTIVKKFKDLSSLDLKIDAAFHTNNRYDAGLWCDALGLTLGFDGERFPDAGVGTKGGTAAKARSIFLINDSSVVLRKYRGLTDRVVKSAQIEQPNNQQTNKGANQEENVKLVSLNGNLIKPGEMKHYWVESVYRGLTPRGIPTFYKHECTPAAARACAGLTGNSKKQCVVNRYEMSLAGSFGPEEVDAMYPTYLPKEWDASEWIATGGGIGPKDQWIRGRRFFRYMHQIHDFPFRKIKWPERGQPPPPRSNCLELLNGSTKWFDTLPFPTKEVLEKFQADMLESEKSL